MIGRVPTSHGTELRIGNISATKIVFRKYTSFIARLGIVATNLVARKVRGGATETSNGFPSVAGMLKRP
jgi:hypothetical protein